MKFLSSTVTAFLIGSAAAFAPAPTAFVRSCTYLCRWRCDLESVLTLKLVLPAVLFFFLLQPLLSKLRVLLLVGSFLHNWPGL